MGKFWQLAPWLTRLILLVPATIFALIASRYFLDPARAGAAIGLSFASPLAVTIVRVGFGAFPLGCSLFTLSCLVSRDRLRIGLGFVALMMALALVVRIAGMLVDHTVSQSMRLVRTESALLVVMAIGAMIDAGRRNHEGAKEPVDDTRPPSSGCRTRSCCTSDERDPC